MKSQSMGLLTLETKRRRNQVSRYAQGRGSSWPEPTHFQGYPGFCVCWPRGCGGHFPHSLWTVTLKNLEATVNAEWISLRELLLNSVQPSTDRTGSQGKRGTTSTCPPPATALENPSSAAQYKPAPCWLNPWVFRSQIICPSTSLLHTTG